MATWLWPARVEAAPNPLTPLSKKQRAILAAIPEDPPPKALSADDHHFLVSDEHHAERFVPHLPQGGVYVGVGPEQSYLYASWTRPVFLLLIDFDQMVVDLHGIYAAFFFEADGGAGIITRWGKPAIGRAAIEAQVVDRTRRKELLSLYERARKVVHPRLQRLRKRHEAAKVKSFLTDEAHFNYVRALIVTGRSRALRGDLTGKRAMAGIAKAAGALGVPVRCLYLSNVEFYFDYDSGLGHNCAIQPTDARSRVLRTVVRTEGKGRYHYCVQRTEHFRAWLETGIERVGQMMARAFGRIRSDRGVLIIPGPR